MLHIRTFLLSGLDARKPSTVSKSRLLRPISRLASCICFEVPFHYVWNFGLWWALSLCYLNTVFNSRPVKVWLMLPSGRLNVFGEITVAIHTCLDLYCFPTGSSRNYNIFANRWSQTYMRWSWRCAFWDWFKDNSCLQRLRRWCYDLIPHIFDWFKKFKASTGRQKSIMVGCFTAAFKLI